MEAVIPLLMAQLIDNGIEADNMNFVLKMGLALIFSAILSFAFGVAAGKTCATASSGFAKNLRHDMYHNVQNFSFSNIDKFSTASIVTRLTTDVNNVQQSFMMIIRMAVRSPMMFVFSFSAVMTISPKMSLIFLVVAPFLIAGLCPPAHLTL